MENIEQQKTLENYENKLQPNYKKHSAIQNDEILLDTPIKFLQCDTVNQQTPNLYNKSRCAEHDCAIKGDHSDNIKSEELKVKESSNPKCSVSLKFKIKLNTITEDNIALYKILSVNDNENSEKIFQENNNHLRDLEYNSNSHLGNKNITINLSEDSLAKCNHTTNKIEKISPVMDFKYDEDQNSYDELNNNVSLQGQRKEVISPDIFNSSNSENEIVFEKKENFKIMKSKTFKEEFDILSSIKNSLCCIPPPNFVQTDLIDFVTFHKNKIFSFIENKKQKAQSNFDSVSSINEILKVRWPNTLNLNYFGIHYNLSKISEEIELLNLKIIERFIRSETSSSLKISCNVKKKPIIITHSPGSRLSHLAKRRATFSSANLQIASQKTTSSINKRQILLNSMGISKYKLPTPKRKIFINKKNSRTPSSAKKNNVCVVNNGQGLCKETSKRALFQSPPQKVSSTQLKPVFKPEIASRVEKSKRALFSPEKIDVIGGTPNFVEAIKRKRSPDDEIMNSRENKIKRFESFTAVQNTDLTRSLKIKSFSVEAGNNISHCESSLVVERKSLIRSSSDSLYSIQLSDSHKKKLLWAVSQALQQKKIGTSHPDFKKHVSVLAKVIKRLFLEFYRNSNSTSETLLKLSTKHVYSVLNGRTSDEIYLLEKANFEKEKKNSNVYLLDSVTPTFCKINKNSYVKRSSTFISTENNTKTYSQSTKQLQSNGLMKFQESSSSHVDYNKSSIQSNNNKSLKNSTNKINFNLEAKENAHCILRKSGQKKFTGKDERNVSPHLDNLNKTNSQNFVQGSVYSIDNIVRAKRQISFDD